jgi:copper(I)-binding protein
LTIDAGQTIDFEESGYHLMLIDLPAALEADATITLTLTFALADGTEFTMIVDAPIALVAPA